jgi:hypothetical protein
MTENKRPTTKCPDCGITVRKDRLGTHMVKYHKRVRRPAEHEMDYCDICRANVRKDRLEAHKLHKHFASMRIADKSRNIHVNVVVSEADLLMLRKITSYGYLSAHDLVTKLVEELIRDLARQHIES